MRPAPAPRPRPGRCPRLYPRARGGPRRVRPGLDRQSRPALGGRGGHARRHDPGGGRQRRYRPVRGRADRGRHRRRRDDRAGVHGRPHPLSRRRLPAGQRGPADRRHAGGVHRPDRRLCRRTEAGGVDHRRRLGSRAVAGHAAPHQGVDRLGHAQQPGLRQPARRAHGRWPTAPRSGPRASRRPPRTFPAARSCATRAPASRPASSRTTPRFRCMRRCPRRPRRSWTRRWPGPWRSPPRKGVTAVNYMSAPTAWLGAFQRARAAGTLTVRTKMFFPIDQWRWVADTVATDRPRRRLAPHRRREGLHGRVARVDHRAPVRAVPRRAEHPRPRDDPARFHPPVGAGRRLGARSRWRCTPSATGPTPCCSTCSTP